MFSNRSVNSTLWATTELGVVSLCPNHCVVSFQNSLITQVRTKKNACLDNCATEKKEKKRAGTASGKRRAKIEKDTTGNSLPNLLSETFSYQIFFDLEKQNICSNNLVYILSLGGFMFTHLKTLLIPFLEKISVVVSNSSARG